jgi:hypothetical protein
VRTTRLVFAALVAAAVLGGAGLAPARAATKPADDVWVGRVQSDGGHYDYVGRACPESAQVCMALVATYRIVPLNPAAARAVRRLSGGQARLVGRLGPGTDNRHTGTLFVRRARPAKPAPATVTVDESANGSTVRLRTGDHLQVVLHSTYWQFNRPNHPGVISADGPPVFGPGDACPPYPGSGCGTVTVDYTAHRPGSAVVSAHRDTCGEALRCTPPAARWSVRVNVAG